MNTMKKCPGCGKDFSDDVNFCSYCGFQFNQKAQVNEKWFHKPGSLIVAFLVVGPLMIPLVWTHPKYKQKTKIIITLVILAVTYIMIKICLISVKSYINVYKQLF